MHTDQEMDHARNGVMARRRRHIAFDETPKIPPYNDDQSDARLLEAATAAVSAAPIDRRRAAIVACFATASGTVQQTQLLQAGSLRDVAFYERQVVELCFQYDLNLIVLACYLPCGKALIPKHLVERFSTFSRALQCIEMSMPYVIWKTGGTMQILPTHLLGAGKDR